MADWIGHSILATVAALIILSSTLIKTRVDEAVVSTIQVRASKKVVLDFAASLERDMRNIGANFPSYDVDPDSSVLWWKTDSTHNYFEFIGQAAPSAPPANIRYQWEVVDSTVVDGETKPLFEVTRYVDGVLLGQSPANFTAVSFELLTDDGQVATLPEEVRQIDVKVMAVSSLGSSDLVRETRWNAVYRPQAIAREDNEDV